jgi:hypothetical protein
LDWSRADLLAAVEPLPERVVDWDPPYRRFAPWADWRSIRASLAHLANGESHYYTRVLGYQSAYPPAAPAEDWRVYLARSRAECMAFLESIKTRVDRSCVREVDLGFGVEYWSVRKVLRRLVRHELLHWKSILRIIACTPGRML